MALKQILAQEGLVKSAAMRVATRPRAFTDNDWMGWAGAEYLRDESDPWILEVQGVQLDPDWIRKMDRDYVRKTGWGNTSDATVIADGEGVMAHFYGRRGDPGPILSKNEKIDDAEEAEAELKLVMKKLQKGVLPQGFSFFEMG